MFAKCSTFGTMAFTPKDDLIGDTMPISNVHTTPHAISTDAKLGTLIQQLHADQTDLEKKLLKDNSRTKSAKKLFSSEAGQKRIGLALKRVVAVQNDIRGHLDKFETRVNNLMQIRGTTDLLILQNYAAAIQDKKPSEIMALNDIDAHRACLLIPTMKFNEGVVKQQDVFRTNAEKMILGDDYDEAQELKEKLDASVSLELGLIKTYDEYEKDVARVKSSMVTSDGIAEPEIG